MCKKKSLSAGLFLLFAPIWAYQEKGGGGTFCFVVLKEKKLTADQAIAFGDGMNDIEMLKGVGKAILMSNAQKELVAALPQAERTTSSKEHGVAAKLNALLDKDETTI